MKPEPVGIGKRGKKAEVDALIFRGRKARSRPFPAGRNFHQKDKDFLLTKACEMDRFVKTELLFSYVFVHSAAKKVERNKAHHK